MIIWNQRIGKKIWISSTLNGNLFIFPIVCLQNNNSDYVLSITASNLKDRLMFVRYWDQFRCWIHYFNGSRSRLIFTALVGIYCRYTNFSMWRKYIRNSYASMINAQPVFKIVSKRIQMLSYARSQIYFLMHRQINFIRSFVTVYDLTAKLVN